jgi:hypothetical protein
MLRRTCPLTLVERWPRPCVSPTKNTLPGGNTRLSPSGLDTSICTPPSRHTTYCLCGAVCLCAASTHPQPSARDNLPSPPTAKEKLRIVTFRGFGWEIAHAAVSRRPPISLCTMVPRTGGYTYDVGVWDLSIIQGPFSVAPCQILTLRFATFSSRSRAPVEGVVRGRLAELHDKSIPGGSLDTMVDSLDGNASAMKAALSCNWESHLQTARALHLGQQADAVPARRTPNSHPRVGE